MERRQVFLVECDRLWDEDGREWRSALSGAGLRPTDVRKALDESPDLRGVMRVELASPAPTREVAEALDADPGDLDDPEEGHVYRAGDSVLLTPASGRMGQEPFEIERGTRLAVRGEMPGGQWSVVPLDGEHDGRMGVLKRKEWDRIAPEMEDLGPEGVGGSDELLDPDEADVDARDDGEEHPAADHDTEEGNPYTVTREFPDWPEKPGFKSHFSFDVDAWAEKKREEIQQRQDQGGGRF